MTKTVALQPRATDETQVRRTRRASGDAHIYAERIKELRSGTGLTYRDIAEAIGTTPRSVMRWVSGESVPRRGLRDRLFELSVVVNLAGEVMKSHVIGLWIFTPNPFLNYEPPAKFIAAEQFREVIGAIRATGEGVFV